MMKWWKRFWCWALKPWKLYKEDKAYKALVISMRNNWHIVATATVKCYEDPKDKATFIGEILIAAKTNELCERTVEVLTRPQGFSVTRHPSWSSYQKWKHEAEPIMPPRKPQEVV